MFIVLVSKEKIIFLYTNLIIVIIIEYDRWWWWWGGCGGMNWEGVKYSFEVKIEGEKNFKKEK